MGFLEEKTGREGERKREEGRKNGNGAGEEVGTKGRAQRDKV